MTGAQMLDAFTYTAPLKTGYIAGQLTVAGVPAVRKVVVLDPYTYGFICSVWSQSDGSYRIPNLDPAKPYLVLGRDYARQYEPVAWDWVMPVV